VMAHCLNGSEAASGGQGTFSSVTDNRNGTYTAIFKGTFSGGNAITAKIDGEAITSAPETISIS
jgi:hypothetical protein